jgi:hypothetical protein
MGSAIILYIGDNLNNRIRIRHVLMAEDYKFVAVGNAANGCKYLIICNRI